MEAIPVEMVKPEFLFGRTCVFLYNDRVRSRHSRRLIHLCIAFGVCVAVLLWYRAEERRWTGRTLTDWEYRFRDLIAITGRFNPPDKRLLFLGIDSASVSISDLDLQTLFSDLPNESTEKHALTVMAAGWPWSREVYALIAARLLDAGARAVVFDLLLPKAGAGDAALRNTFQRYGNRLIIGSNFVRETIGPGQHVWSLDLPTPSVIPDPSPAHLSIGYVNFWPDADTIVRRVQYRATLDQLQSNTTPPEATAETPSSLAWLAAQQLQPVSLSQPFAQHVFRYSGPPETFQELPVYQIFVPRYWQRNLADGTAIRDKIILIGPYGNWAHDEHPTPFGQMAGPELQLNSINALVHGAFIRELPRVAGDVLIAAAAAVALCLTLFLGKVWLRLGAFLLSAAGYLLAIKLSYDYGNAVVPGMPPLLTLAVAGLGSFVYDYAHETLEKLRIRRTLESYVSKDVVREVLDNPASYLTSLGGRRAQVAIIVTDLRDFTTMAEQVESTQLVAQLNEYLSVMVEDIFACRGSIDKFIGDAVLAVWGHVNSSGPATDALQAIEAALRMKQSLARLNTEWQKRGLPPFAMGCGLNFGEVVFGNIGSAQKMEPTVIGDTVNVTARLESLTKDYGRDLLLGEAAADLVQEFFTLQLVDRVVLKGKTKPLKIYTIIARADAQLDEATAEYLRAYNQAQSCYAAGQFEGAIQHFTTCAEHLPQDQLAAVYLARCRAFIARPPSKTWTGVHVAEHK